MTPPMNTPWGVSQGAPEVLAPGIVSYSTASHGGIWLDPEHLEKVPAAWRGARFSGSQTSPWFEEDCDWALVALTFPEAFSADAQALAKRAFAHWHAPKIGGSV
jgi:hypothetical protein